MGAPGKACHGKESIVKDKVLLVDDDAMVLASLKRHLRNRFRIDTALSGEEALEKINTSGPYAVIVSDYMMPGMNGIEFLCRAKEITPDTMRMMLTGTADMPTAIKAVNEGSIFQFHPKPCPAETLGEAIASGIEEYRKITAHRDQLQKFQSSLAQAGTIQQKLMPRSVPRVPGFDMAGKSIWCDETSGDYYDFISPPDWDREKIGMVVADVIGHGISSALLMTTVRAVFRERILSPAAPAEIVSDVNRRLVHDIEELNLFVTMFYCEIDINAKRLCWVHAGHESALLYLPGSDSFDTLGGEGIPLGVMGDWSTPNRKKPCSPARFSSFPPTASRKPATPTRRFSATGA